MNTAILTDFLSHLHKTAMMQTTMGTGEQQQIDGSPAPRINTTMAINQSNPFPGQNGNEKGPLPITNPQKPLKGTESIT